MPPPELPLEPPLGTYDALPEAALHRRALEQQLRELFTRWGYQEVITPTLELDEVVRRAGLALSGRQLYRFVDREGQVLTLRPDWTPAVARLVAARMRQRLPPLRLFYLGSVFRYERPRPDSPREFVQAGVELVGCAGALADAEAIALAVEACRTAGIEDARVEIGHAGYVQALMELLPEPAQEAAREALTRRDLVAYEQAVAQGGLEGPAGHALAQLPRTRGGPAVVRRALEGCPSPAAARALASLEELWRHLERLELARVAAVDLGLVKDLDYYTGVVFEVYAPDAGYSLAAGGRYDGLLSRFGVPLPATGFAASVDRLAAVAGRRGRKPGRPALVWVLPRPADDHPYDASAVEAAWELAAALRSWGIAAAADLVERPVDESLRAAREHGASWVVAPVPGRPASVRALALVEHGSPGAEQAGKGCAALEGWAEVDLDTFAARVRARAAGSRQAAAD